MGQKEGRDWSEKMEEEAVTEGHEIDQDDIERSREDCFTMEAGGRRSGDAYPPHLSCERYRPEVTSSFLLLCPICIQNFL